MAHIAGLVAGGVHMNPVPYGDVVTTTTHKTLRGPRGGMILCKQAYAQQIDKGIFPGTQGGPLMHVIAAKAVCFREAMTPAFQAYAARVCENAQAWPRAYRKRGSAWFPAARTTICSSSTGAQGYGKEVEALLDAAHITANKNTVPKETRSPFVTSGIRLGTAAATTRGLGPEDFQLLAGCIAGSSGRGRLGSRRRAKRWRRSRNDIPCMRDGLALLTLAAANPTGLHWVFTG